MSEFSIAGKGLKLDTAEDVKVFVDQIKDTKNLKKIVIMGNTIGVEASKALAEALKNQEDLEYADFSDIYTGRLKEEIPDSLDYLLTALLSCKNLHTIDLSDNAFGIMTIEPLEKFLSQHTPLEHLILANNGLGPAAGTRVAAALETLAKAKKDAKVDKKLVTVICGRNRLENGSMEAWSKFLAAHGTIKDIRLPQNGIRQEGIEHLLLNGLSQSPELEKLDLQDNTFTIQGAQALAKTLPKWNKITDIGISDCLLSARGAELLADALLTAGVLEDLEHLRLQYNEIEADGASKLASAIKTNVPNLKILELNGNKFPEDHDIVDEINALFEERGFGELDELDDMELDSDEEEDEDESDREEEEREHAASTIVRDAEEAEDSNVPAEKSASVDDLASKLAKTDI